MVLLGRIPKKISYNGIKKRGNPYKEILEADDKIAVLFGITGIPETFIVNSEQKIIHHIRGSITKDIMEEEILPFFSKNMDYNNS